jgi:AbrB family looped-hinge helix DNA binding protein
MPNTVEQVLARKFIRVRERNQITLPTEVISGLSIHAGDFLEISRTADGLVHLKPTVLVTVDSPGAEREEALAYEDIANRRYGTFGAAAELVSDIKDRRNRKNKGNTEKKTVRAAG